MKNSAQLPSLRPCFWFLTVKPETSYVLVAYSFVYNMGYDADDIFTIRNKENDAWSQKTHNTPIDHSKSSANGG